MKITNSGSIDQAFKTKDGLEIVKVGATKTISDKILEPLNTAQKKHYEQVGIVFERGGKTRSPKPANGQDGADAGADAGAGDDPNSPANSDAE